MIVVDTSALIAIIAKEPEQAAMMAAIAATERRSVSAVSILETRIVIHGRAGNAGIADLDQLLDDITPEIVDFSAAQAVAAFAAFLHWGKGIHARARLNICDCASYALAKSLNVPLLFKGEDFRATDINAAL